MDDAQRAWRELGLVIRVEQLQGVALLVGPDQGWLTTMGFLEKIDSNLDAALLLDFLLPLFGGAEERPRPL